MRSLKERWMLAQGWAFLEILRRLDDYFGFEAWSCVVCGRKWRPGDESFISIVGSDIPVSAVDSSSESFLTNGRVWYCQALNLISSRTDKGFSVRLLCHWHRDRWESVVDCVTGETIILKYCPPRVNRMWRDVLFWSNTMGRFIWKCVIDMLWAVLHPRTHKRWVEFMRRYQR